MDRDKGGELVDDLVRCCSDTRYLTERLRKPPLPIG